METCEDFILNNGGELEKLQIVEDDAYKLKELVAREDELTSLDPNEKKEEVVEHFLEMTIRL